MPIYEYKCRDCGTVSELLVGVTQEQPAIACEDCGSESVDRLVSQVSFAIHAGLEDVMGGSAASSCSCGGSCSCGSSGGCSCGGSCSCG